MRDCDTGAVPVVDNGRPVGMLTDRDIVIRAVATAAQPSDPRDRHDGVICGLRYVDARSRRLMSVHQIRRLPVVENERIVGIVSLGDIAVKEAKDKRTGDTLERISEGVRSGDSQPNTSPIQIPNQNIPLSLVGIWNLGFGIWDLRPQADGPRNQERQQNQHHNRDEGHARPPRALEERPLGRWLYPRLRRRVPASIANQRLVGDLGSTVFADHRRLRSTVYRLPSTVGCTWPGVMYSTKR